MSQNGNNYKADNLIDGDFNTAWSEGVSGYGEGETITISLKGSYLVSELSINGGYQKSEKAYYKYSRPKEILLCFSNGQECRETLYDIIGKQTVNFVYPVETDYVKIKILSV